jgi:hypothetical protein
MAEACRGFGGRLGRWRCVQGSGDTRDYGLLDSEGGASAGVTWESTSRPWTGWESKREGKAEEGGLGIMKEAAVEAPDG